MRNLREISVVDVLSPWINTLTFGSADVTDQDYGLEARIEMAEHDEDIHQNLLSIGQSWQDYSQLSVAAVKQRLNASLERFPQLRNLRMVLNDEPSYLHGWLTQDQREYIMANFKPGSPFWELSDSWFRPEFFYDSLGLDTAYYVLQALRKIGHHVQDLQLSSFDDFCTKVTPDTLHWLLPDTLYSLRMSLVGTTSRTEKVRR